MDILSFFPVAMAQEAAAQGAAQPSPSIVEMLVMPAVFLVIIYFLIIKPQQKKAREQNDLLANLKAGDEVVTSGGMIGKIKAVADSFVTLEISNNTNVKILKGSITSLSKTQMKEPAKA